MEIVWLALKKFCTMYGETGLLIVVLLIGIAVWIYFSRIWYFVSFIKTGEVLLVEEGKILQAYPNIPGYGVKDNKIAPALAREWNSPSLFLEFFWVGFLSS